MTVSATDFVVVGDVMVDTFVAIDGAMRLGGDQSATFTRAIGGQAGNTASWLAHLGATVRLVASCGADEDSSWVAHQLDLLGVRAQLLTGDQSTGRCVIIVDVDGRRTMFSDPGANRALASIPDEMWLHQLSHDPAKARRHLHLSGYLLDRSPTLVPDLADLVCDDSADGSATTVSLDTAAMAIGTGQRATLVDALANIDLLLGTVEELSAFLPGDTPQTHTVDQLIDAWRTCYPSQTTLVVKNGAHGATADAYGIRVHQPAHQTKAVDTTGAGDAFAAGFLAAWSPGREHLTQALASGAEVAALAVGHIGAGPPPPKGR